MEHSFQFVRKINYYYYYYYWNFNICASRCALKTFSSQLVLDNFFPVTRNRVSEILLQAIHPSHSLSPSVIFLSIYINIILVIIPSFPLLVKYYDHLGLNSSILLITARPLNKPYNFLTLRLLQTLSISNAPQILATFFISEIARNSS